jgi:hypothetical protein
MRFTNKINQRGATGYILLWLLGIPIPILLLIFCEVAIKGKSRLRVVWSPRSR